MEKLMEWIAKINGAINGIVWGLPMIILILGTGIFLTVRTRALPNLVGLILMSGVVVKITKNYFDRKKGKAVEPMLSAYPEQNTVSPLKREEADDAAILGSAKQSKEN